jgi:hypothetical protein
MDQRTIDQTQKALDLLGEAMVIMEDQTLKYDDKGQATTAWDALVEAHVKTYLLIYDQNDNLKEAHTNNG